MGLPAVKCKACRMTFKHPGSYKRFPSSTLVRHNEQCPKAKRARISQTDDGSDIRSLLEQQSLHDRDPGSTNITETDVKNIVLDFFISGNIPFNQADNPEFKKLMQLIKIHGKRVMINRKVIRAQLTANAAMARTDLKKQLATNISRVSLAMDGWTSRLNNSYLGIPNPFIL